MSALGQLPDGEINVLERERIARLRRRLDRATLEMADLTQEAAECDLAATADALGRAWRLLVLVAGPPHRLMTAAIRASAGLRNLNCPECGHQIESLRGIAQHECPQCGSEFFDEDHPSPAGPLADPPTADHPKEPCP